MQFQRRILEQLLRPITVNVASVCWNSWWECELNLNDTMMIRTRRCSQFVHNQSDRSEIYCFLVEVHFNDRYVALQSITANERIEVRDFHNFTSQLHYYRLYSFAVTLTLSYRLPLKSVILRWPKTMAICSGFLQWKKIIFYRFTSEFRINELSTHIL